MNGPSRLSGWRCLTYNICLSIVSSLRPLEPRERMFAVLFAVWGWIPSLLTVVIFILNLFLILIVLIQRGKGGGLAGAFGGAGGSSAFGSRAGDTFTKITIGLGIVWIVLTMVDVVLVQQVARTTQTESSVLSPD